MCATVPQPATGSTEKPSTPLICTSSSWPKAANTKLGTEMPSITASMMSTSGSRLRYSAVNAPHSTPPRPAKAMAKMPRVAETGKCSRMMSFTRRFSWV